MKKTVGLVISIICLVLVASLGYKFIYKISPREFITKDTRIIYANEGINNKNFSQLLPFLENEEQKKSFEKNVKKLKYISKVYVFSDKEFYEFGKKNAVVVVDPGFFYPLYLTKINEYFEPVKDGVFKMLPETRDKYFSEVKEDIFLLPYRGLFILAVRPGFLKEFSENPKKYMYDKDIENYLDENRDNLLGTLVYSNKGIDFYGIDYFTITGTVKNNLLDIEQRVVLNKETAKKYQSTKSERELVKYLDKGDIYIAPDDFSKVDNLLFNPYIIGQNVDKNTFVNIWKGIFDIDIEEMLQEIDGEVLIRNSQDGISGMFKMKKDFPETRKFLNILNSQNGLFSLKKEIEIKDNNILVVGENNFEEKVKNYNLPKGTFLFGDLDLSRILRVPDLDVKVLGYDNEIKVDVEMSAKTLKEIERRY